jgi:hypothetical protein
MLAKVMNIRGVLTPLRQSGVLEPRVIVRVSFGNHGLGKSLQEMKVAKDSSLEFDSTVKVKNGHQAAIRFLERLNKFIQTDHVSVLELEGFLIITFDGDEGPVMIRVKVQEGKVAYQEAQLIWESETVI